MEVYVENNVSGKGKWIPLPQPPKALQECLDKYNLTSDGEYQLSYIRGELIYMQQCVGNLFLLNQKLFRYLKLSPKRQSEIVDCAYDEGISFEEALYEYVQGEGDIFGTGKFNTEV